jgi:uncharacterized protein (TIGR02611 family)
VGQEETRGRRSPLIERVRARQQRHRERNRIFRAAFAVAGFVVLLAGLVMLVTPGPGIPVIILGLTMLALEFAWAERWLERVVDRAERAVEQVRHGSPARRAAVLSIGGLAAAGLITLTVLLWDIPLLPG